MKNLLYKEFRLSVHPLTYLFLGLMALICLSPGIPVFICLIYFGSSYVFLFIGMNKTTTTNDLFYTCTLPINRKDVVTARICSTSVLQLVELVYTFVLFAFTKFVIIRGMSMEDQVKIAQQMVTIDIGQGIYLVGAFLICFGVYDLIYLPWFYRNGKSIILNMFAAIIGIAVTGALLTIVPHYIKGAQEALTVGGSNANYFIQFGFLILGIGLWIGSKFLVRHLSVKRLVKLDF